MFDRTTFVDYEPQKFISQKLVFPVEVIPTKNIFETRNFQAKWIIQITIAQIQDVQNVRTNVLRLSPTVFKISNNLSEW